jgi:hypothetical protein
VPGVIFFLGVSNKGERIGVPHSPTYVVDDAAMAFVLAA